LSVGCGLRGFGMFPYWLGGLHNKLAALRLTTLSTYCISFTLRVRRPPSLESENWPWKLGPRSCRCAGRADRTLPFRGHLVHTRQLIMRIRAVLSLDDSAILCKPRFPLGLGRQRSRKRNLVRFFSSTLRLSEIHGNTTRQQQTLTPDSESFCC
jgi:hypothetical protein